MGKNVSVSYPLVLGGRDIHTLTVGEETGEYFPDWRQRVYIKTLYTHPLTQPSTRAHRSPRYRNEHVRDDKVSSKRGLVTLSNDQ